MFRMSAMRSIASLLVAASLLAGCGGGGKDHGPPLGGGGSPQSPQPSGIGPSGGTVSGPNGARVTVPAGALASSTPISIEQSSQGAPPLPAGLTGVGPMFAFTPHGTQFAAPATVTVPYDEAAANGATPFLYKTNRQDEWELVSGATFASGAATAQVSSFSHFQVVVPPLVRNDPTRRWEFYLLPGDGGDLREIARGEQVGGEVDEIVDFGLASSLTAEFGRANETVLEDYIANGFVFGRNDGATYGALAEAPDGRLGTAEAIGSSTHYVQAQSFIKRASDARLTYTVTAVTLYAEDFNLPILTGPAPLVSAVDFGLTALKPEVFQEIAGTATLYGENEHFWFEAETAAHSHDMLWFRDNFQITIEDVGYQFPADPDQSCRGTRATLQLVRPISVSIDLSSVDIDEEFTVHSYIVADAIDRRGGSGGADCQASYVGAFLRDPAQIDGTTIEFEGLEPTNRPLPLEPQPFPPEPVECTATTNPLAEAGVLQFEAANFAIDESPQAVRTIAVTRTGGATGRVSASFATSDGTATAGEDYTATSTTVFFADGESGKRLVSVPIRRDILPEGDETVQLTLSQPGGCAALGSQATATLSIRNDDALVPLPTFTVSGSVAGLEGEGLVIEEATSGSRLMPTADGDFSFAYRFLQGSTYNVRVATQPTNPIQVCAVNNPSGVIASEDVSSVSVVCHTNLPSGWLDDSFGSGGRVTAGLTGGADAIALQSDGKIVALGNRRLARYNANGSLDTTFGTAGEIAIAFVGNTYDATHDLALQADGKIVVVGMARPGGVSTPADLAIARFNADGTLDSTFGTSGKAYVDFQSGADAANAVIVLADGRILAIGYATITADDVDFAVARFTPDGVLDTSFSDDGRVTINIAGELDRANTAALQSDGAIVLAGEVRADRSNPADVGVARLTADGAMDTSFGSGGIVHVDYADSDSAEDIAIQSDGKIVLVGYALVGSTSDFMIARLDAEGRRDASFGSAGLVTTPFGTLQDIAHAVAIQADGAIVVAGSASSSTVSDFGLVRLRADGSFDSSFGGAGSVLVDFFAGADGANSLVLQPDGRVVVAGVARNGSTNGLGIARVAP